MRHFYFLFLFFTLLSCGENAEEATAKNGLPNNFHIEGIITGAASQKIKIEANSQHGPIVVAETTTDAGGNYVIDGNIPGMGLYTMNVGGDPAKTIVLPMQENDRVTISSNVDKFAVSPVIKGPNWAKPLMTYMNLFNQFAEAQMTEMPKIKDENLQIARFKELRKPLEAFVKKQIETDPANTVNIVLTSLIVPTQELGYANWDPANMALLKKMEEAFLEKHTASPFTGMLSQQVTQIETEYANYAQFTSGKLAAPEIALKNPEGKELRLSNLKGKVVLVDFWASWCGPCRRENPNVVRLYKQFKAKGFEVFSVSLDQDANAWKTAIKNDGLIWPNHVSDLMGWQTPLTALYGFNAIPYTVLLNREGNIIGVGLRGADLEQKLVEALSKK